MVGKIGLVITILVSFSVADGYKTITRAKYNQMKQEPKVALVIGNKDYEVDSLTYSLIDARKIKKFLEHPDRGFTVIYDENVKTKGKLRKLINQFINTIEKDGTGVFYFSGHGMSAYNKNYLIPTRNSSINDDEDIEDIGLSVNYLLRKLEKKNNRLNIVMLDACRNTLGKGASSAFGGDSAEGVFIAYATAEGKRAKDDGLFASSFVENAKIRGLSVEEVFKNVRKRVKRATGQTPFTNSGIVGDFYFSLPFVKKSTINKVPSYSYTKLELNPKDIEENVQSDMIVTDSMTNEKPIRFQIATLKSFSTAQDYVNRLSLPQGLSAYVQRGVMNKVIITGISSIAEVNRLKMSRFPGGFIIQE